MKPRRWYSSPEISPTVEPHTSPPFISLIQLAYAAKTYRQQGSILKLTIVVPERNTHGRDHQSTVARAILRRIDAA